MEQYISKSALVAEIERIRTHKPKFKVGDYIEKLIKELKRRSNNETCI